jgi:flagellar biosynthetic protein FliP
MTEVGLQPLMANEISYTDAADAASGPLREFMFDYTREPELELVLDASTTETPVTRDEVPLTALIPAFVLSELQTAFEIGFLILIPFLIIDMVIASTVMSMGMVMLPPVVISLPFKILLFVLVDGWHLVTESLVRGFAT